MFPSESVPERIGAYRVLKYVGNSGAADVYVARMEGPLGFARDVTLKMVRYSLDQDAQFVDELGREAAICARLNHPAIVRMFDFFEHDRRLVLVLEQVEGASLDRLLTHLARRKQKLTDGAIFFLAAQLAAGLAHAHASSDEDGNQSPVIHRDLKPENVLIGWDGQVRLAGFGLGKILGRTPDSVAGTIRGTPGWMSPEQARGERATVRSDVYGFGMLLWSLLVGEDPPTDGARPAPLSQVRPDLPREIHAAVEAALEPSPDRRKIGAAEIAQWVGKLIKPEAGREELRQKVLWLRSTRGPASKVDPGKPQGPQPKTKPRRRQNLQAMRAATSIRRPSVPAPPSSRRPSGGIPRPEPRSARSGAPQQAHEQTLPMGMRIPPPPPLPADAQRTGEFTAPTFGPPPVPQRGHSGPPTLRPPSSMRAPAPVNVRTVSTAPPPLHRAPSARPGVVQFEDLMRPEDQGQPYYDGSHSQQHRSQHPASQSYHPPHDPYGASDPHGHRSQTERPPAPAFTLVNQLLLAGLTAGFVVAIGLLVLRGTNQGQPQQQPQPQQLAQQLPAQQQPPQPTAPPSPTAVVTAEPTAAVPPPVVTSPADDRPKPDAMPDPSMLDNTTGYLMVKGPTNADVYLNGVRRGATSEAMLVPCGRFFMRIAPPTTKAFPEWLTKGETVFVACRSATVLQVETTAPKDDVTPAPLPIRPKNGGFGL